MAGRFKSNDGDWVCSDPRCGNVNFARRDTCNKCGIGKESAASVKKGGTEIGKALAEKSKGLFSADDWQCKTCGNVNWARRNSCNMCNAPKFGKVESRTGFGGGYMERDEVVEYKDRVSDDEYDEFGRKKKKRSQSSVNANTGRNAGSVSTKDSGIRRPDANEESDDDKDDDDDEEEDDGDDGDLSKYKLDSDDEDNRADDSKRKVDKESRRSASSPSSERSDTSSSSDRSESSDSGSESDSRSRSSSSSPTKKRSRSSSEDSKRETKRRHRSP